MNIIILKELSKSLYPHCPIKKELDQYGDQLLFIYDDLNETLVENGKVYYLDYLSGHYEWSSYSLKGKIYEVL